jgi:hypothetical protein
MREHGSATPRYHIHRYAASLQFRARGPVDQDDLAGFEILLPCFIHAVSFCA